MKNCHCTHSDEERCTVGTWVVHEIRKAEDMAYRLLELFEFW